MPHNIDSPQISLHYNIPTPSNVNTFSVEVKPECHDRKNRVTLKLKSLWVKLSTGYRWNLNTRWAHFYGSVPDTAGRRLSQTWWSWTLKCCLDLFLTLNLWSRWVIKTNKSVKVSIFLHQPAIFLLSTLRSSVVPCWWIVLKRIGTEFSSTSVRSDKSEARVDLHIRSQWWGHSFRQQLLKDIPINHTLDLIQETPVQNLKPALVKIYDYYQPSRTFSSAPPDIRLHWKSP